MDTRQPPYPPLHHPPLRLIRRGRHKAGHRTVSVQLFQSNQDRKRDTRQPSYPPLHPLSVLLEERDIDTNNNRRYTSTPPPLPPPHPPKQVSRSDPGKTWDLPPPPPPTHTLPVCQESWTRAGLGTRRQSFCRSLVTSTTEGIRQGVCLHQLSQSQTVVDVRFKYGYRQLRQSQLGVRGCLARVLTVVQFRCTC